MTLYVGGTYQVDIAFNMSGLTFTRVSSKIAGDDVVWNPTITEDPAGSAIYHFEYDIDDVGAHAWVAETDGDGRLSINFDVDADPGVSTTIILPTIPILGQLSGNSCGYHPLILAQARSIYIPFKWFGKDEDGVLYMIDTTGYLARLTIRADFGGGAQLTLTTGDGTIETGFNPPKWAANTAYSNGQRVIPKTGPNGVVYQVITAGTTGASQPTWPTTIGATVSSGSVVFSARASDWELLSNMRIVLDPEDTEELVSWGTGVYDLIWQDNFGNEVPLLMGPAMLQLPVTDPIG